jgi:outer membrane receptor protein involved in Fe transport
MTMGPASGQDNDIEQVVVSASRISIAGYQQPTPVSVIGSQQLLEAANADIGDTLRQMPSMGASLTPEKGSNSNASNSAALGVSNVNLRNLGQSRNLVLFDGARMVSPILAGGVDLTVIPNTVIQRVDVVTGGASAAWGSDAVSGVINLVVNRNFSGLKASVDLSDTGQDLRRSYGFTVTNGFDMLGGRSHFEWAVTFNDSPSLVMQSSAHWYSAQGLVANPAYEAGDHTKPQLIHVTNGGERDVAGGDTATNTGAAAALNGIQFGPNGTPMPYVLGNCDFYAFANTAPYISQTISKSVSFCPGGTATQKQSAAGLGIMSFPLQQATGFVYGTYRVTPDIVAHLMLNYGFNHGLGSSLTIDASETIKSDNAFLPASVLAQMNALKVTSITVSTAGFNTLDPNTSHDISDFYSSFGTPVSTSLREMTRAEFGLDGALGEDWSWKASVQHSQNLYSEVDTSIEIKTNLDNAADAVFVTSANKGTSSLTIGSIACRSTLTNPTNGCVPFNIFGVGVESQQAIDYIVDHNDFYHLNMQQDTFDASVQGVLPWNLTGAGAPAVSFGVDYRKETAVSTADALGAQGALGGGNFVGIRGEVNDWEGFAELDAPLIKNGFVQSLDYNMAGRITDYSLSGMVETWKLGLTSQLTDDFKLRATWSYDIRAPNLGELFNTIPASGGQIDYKNGINVPSALSEAAGNTNLLPEKSTTISGGVVFTPSFIEGLSMSLDWYSIVVKGIISAPSTTLERNFCLAGTKTPTGGSYCDDWVYGAPIVAGSNPNGLRFVFTFPYNNGFLQTSGLDFVADYTMDLFSGNLAWHLLGNYTDEETQTIFGSSNPDGSPLTYDYAGSMGPGAFAGVPKIHMTLSATYTEGPWTGTIQSRYYGHANLVNGWQSGVQVDNNDVSQVAYLDLRGTYKWNDNVQLYLSVDNALDVPPPLTVGYSPSTNGLSRTNPSQYDVLGRMYHGGIRFSFQ